MDRERTVGSGRAPRPAWLKAPFPTGETYFALKGVMRGLALHTVCEEARCPNIGECWQRRSATFMILGDVCTRACGFCAVKTGIPPGLDLAEPARVAEAVARMELDYAVITSVDRDDLADGGATVFANTVSAIRSRLPSCRIEILTPDFKKSLEASIDIILPARPDVWNHNVETTPRLYRKARPGASFDGSLLLLRRVKARAPDLLTKSGFMVGLGETMDEARDVLRRLCDSGVDMATIGQYLQPTKDHLPVARFVHPDEFRELGEYGEGIGIPHVASGPLVRSSYHASEQTAATMRRAGAATPGG